VERLGGIMGFQYDVNDHTFENRRESVIFYDGFWYEEKTEAMLFGDDASQTVEMDKKYLALILAYFDQPGKRTLFGLGEFIANAKKNLRDFEHGEVKDNGKDK
jgi:hypothetical protein